METSQYGYVRSRDTQLVSIFAEQVFDIRYHAILSSHIQVRVLGITGESDGRTATYREVLTDNITHCVCQCSVVQVIRSEQRHFTRRGLVGQLQRTRTATLNDVAVTLTQHQLEEQHRIEVEIQPYFALGGTEIFLFLVFRLVGFGQGVVRHEMDEGRFISRGRLVDRQTESRLMSCHGISEH